MFCPKTVLPKYINLLKKTAPVVSFAFILTLALLITNKATKAAKLADGVWTQSGSPGTTTITFTNTTAAGASSDVVLTFPSGASVDQDGTTATVVGTTNYTRTNNTVDNTITINLLDGTLAAGAGITITLADGLTSYTTTTYAQESLAINTQDPTDTPLDFGVALITNDNTTTVSTQVPLFVNLDVDTTTIELGTLSTASVSEADQTYTINSNNRTGVLVAIQADGPMNDSFGNTINAVTDGTVTAGDEEYGISVDGVSGMTIESPFDSGDDEVPQAQDNIANTASEISNGTFDVNYKASITGTTIAGSYDQVVTVTISTNS
jgi:hypothetical protein